MDCQKSAYNLHVDFEVQMKLREAILLTPSGTYLVHFIIYYLL